MGRGEMNLNAASGATDAEVTAAVATHAGLADPHTGYVLESLLDAKGDLIAASAADTPAKLTAGANGLALVAASGEATGLIWGTPSFIGAAVTSTTTMVDNTATQMAFSATTFDSSSFVSSNTFVVPAGLGGKYSISCYVEPEYLVAANDGLMFVVKKNGAAIRTSLHKGSDDAQMVVAGKSAVFTPVVLAVADVITIFIEQNSGGDRAVNASSFGIEFLGA